MDAINNLSKAPNEAQVNQAEAKPDVDNVSVEELSQNSRQSGVDMATKTSSKVESTKIKSAELGKNPVKALNFLMNGAKKLGSKALNIIGFAGATVTAGLYFLLNLRLPAIITAVPTAMSFYIAHNLKKSVEEDKDSLGVTDEPSAILKEACNSSSFLEDNLNKVLESAVEVSDMKNTNPKYAGIIEDLSSIAKKLRAKKYEIEKIDSASSNNYEVLEIDRFLEIFEAISPEENVGAIEEAFVKSSVKKR